MSLEKLQNKRLDIVMEILANKVKHTEVLIELAELGEPISKTDGHSQEFLMGRLDGLNFALEYLEKVDKPHTK